MKTSRRWMALLAVALPLTGTGADLSAQLPTGERWLAHFRDDLLPFWNLPDAWGPPRGDFPTWRCNDGRRLDPARPCAELAKAAIGRDYTRMQARQTYFYGVAFHLSGDPRMLALARDGVAYLRRQRLDADSGSAVTWRDAGAAGPPPLQRTTQDLAYAQLGMAMYWVLTRDEAVLADILRLKEHIFTRYWDAQLNMLRWTVEDDPALGEASSQRQELVAQLDQVNAYMLLLAPLLPEPHRSTWTADLVRLARGMVRDYWAPQQQLFKGTLPLAEAQMLGTRHVDFGHSAKALWMIERIGRLAREPALIAFATEQGQHLLQRAYLEGSGSWASRPLADGTPDEGKEWWIYAELDQLAATLALADPAPTRYLARSTRFWLEHQVDPVGHEVWGWVDAEGTPRAGAAKIGLWKNGYHSAEHALVNYLAAQSLQRQPAVLYFAFADPAAPVRPYFFTADVQSRRSEPLPGFAPLQRTRVEFGAVQ